MQDKVSALRHTNLRYDRHLITEGWVQQQQPLILGDGRIEIMAPLLVSHINFGPRRRQKYVVTITTGSSGRVHRRLTGQVLKGGRRIEQAPVKEHPSGPSGRGGTISEREFNGTPREGDLVHPRQHQTVA